MFEFNLIAEDGNARRGSFKTPHGEIQTPVFMPVGTKATVKTLSQEDLQDLNAQIILGNTYHLYLRPGEKLIQEMGKLHKWMNWNGPILTDSGGFQVFSLARESNFAKESKHNTQVKINEDGVEFKSHLDGSLHYFTPEKAIEIQHDLGADIIMAFDECAPAESSDDYFKSAMIRTHNWLERCKKRHQGLLEENGEERALFGIVQGGLSPDLRKESAKFVDSLDLPGNAIGGLSVGESKDQMQAMLEHTCPHLSPTKPRYLMGVGTPEDLLECVERGIDMFDCVHPTRMSRHGAFWTESGRHSITNEKFKKDSTLMLTGYSRSYLRHLFMEKEISGQRLLTMHNLKFLLNLMTKIRQSIEDKNFKNFKKDFLATYKKSL
jgi:queuine tRNA-ribosyltransferase